MPKPRIFLGSSGKQAKLLQALTRGLEDIAHVDPWTTSFNPGTTTLERLVELAHEVDFAAFVFASDDWTTGTAPRPIPREPARLLRETMSSSRQVFSAGSSECAAPSSSMRAAQSFQPICSGLRPYDMAKRRRGDESRHSEASQRDRKRRADRPDRGPVVAILADGAQPCGAFRRQPAADLARPRRRAGAERTLLARRRQAVGEILRAKR